MWPVIIFDESEPTLVTPRAISKRVTIPPHPFQERAREEFLEKV